jgi:hypothetical protein
MSLKDKVTSGAERAVEEAEKVFDKGKAKVSELQVEMQMDGQAKKLGYLVFDFYRGREVDQAQRQKYLDELSRLEDQLIQGRADAAAKKQAAEEEKARKKGTSDPGEPVPINPDDVWQQGPAAGAAAAAAAGEGAAASTGVAAEAAEGAARPAPSYPPVPPTEPDCNIPADVSEAARQSNEETFKDDGTWSRGDA